jgi:hypothetical protein
MTLGSESATSIDPIEPVSKNPSEMFSHDKPAFTVFQTPPEPI